MNILKFLAVNWDSALIVLGVLAVIVALIAKKQWALLDTILFNLVTEAERKFGNGTGALKLTEVIKQIYPYIPAVVQWFINMATIEKAVEKVLAEAKIRWEKNPKLIEGK